MREHLSLLSLVFILFLCFSADAGLAQKGIITGTVYDAQTGETIPFANIIKDGTSTGTQSREDGSYEFRLNPGNHSIQFSSLSYKDTLIQVTVAANETYVLDVRLNQDLLLMDEIVISADRVTRKVQQLASRRNRLNEGLNSYEADIYKLAILANQKQIDTSETELSPIAFSERVTKVQYILKPERYSETLLANRSSKNFFSEYDFFSTGGPPLNLNQDMVPLSILSEDITVPGPISTRAGRFYELDDDPAGSEWPEETIKITIKPKFDNRVLFEGYVWFNDSSSTILGIDVRLNDYATTNTGLFSISNLRYQQTYKTIDNYWLPASTKLSAELQFITSGNPIIYQDEWSWTEHNINPEGLNASDLELNTKLIEPNSHKKRKIFWDTLATTVNNDNLTYLKQAQNYTERNRTLSLGMSAVSKFFRLPYQLERFYLTNISDIYHFNRVEGHYLGIGIRTPVNSKYNIYATSGYGFSSERATYTTGAYYFIPGTAFAPDISYRDDVVRQYQDYEYNRTPIDFFEFRQTMTALSVGSVHNNYFRRKGVSAGIRYRFDVESFIRVLYLNETHELLRSNTPYTLFGSDLEPVLFPNNDPIYPAQNGNVNGLSVHLHHDTRKYLRTQFLRDYNIRDFGWLVDAKLEKGISDWGSDFDYNRYRLGFKFNVPVFTQHFIQTDIFIAASDAGTPNQRLFTFNGFVLDDYVREQPFNTLNFKNPVSYRSSVIKIKYKFGSSITRKAPVNFIQKSGIHLATFITGGIVDRTATLEPLLPYSGAEPQAEIGIAAFKIFGFLYAEFSKRLIGDYGDSFGLTVLF